MTLILSAFSEGGTFISASDVLLSVEHRDPVREVSLPLRHEPRNVSSDNSTAVGTAQKAILLSSDALLLWSGPEVVARAVAKELREAIAAGWTGDFHRFLAGFGLSEGELNASSFILHRLTAPDRIRRQVHNTKAVDVHSQRVQFAGSGSWDFLFDTHPSFDAAPDDPAMRDIAPWIMRLGLAILAEMADGRPLQFAYGGWFEITIVEENAFRKLPYAVKFWSVTNKGIESGPAFSAWYQGDHLVILSADLFDDATQNLMKISVISGANAPPQTTEFAGFAQSFQPPRFQLHIVENQGRHYLLMKEGDWPGYQLKFSGLEVQVEFTDNALALFENLVSGKLSGGGRVARPYSGGD